jgi:N-acetylglucosaminyl-diphospho-decaprenol L-rhamnosyltransferase
LKNVTAAVVLHNGVRLIPTLANTISSLPKELSIVVYDSGSSDGSAQAASETLGNAEVIRGGNHGFGFGNNRCLEKVETEYILLLNSDASIQTESLIKLVHFLDQNPDYAGVQPLVRLWGWNRVTASAGVFLTGYGEAWDSRFMHLELSPLKTAINVPAITAAVSLWRTEALKQVNGFDEHFFMYFEDADLSLRLGALEWKLAVVRDAEALHMVGASSDRKKALIWELESSIRVFRRYIGNGRLTGQWWIREMKILLHCIKNGNSPVWRLKAVSRALQKPVSTVLLPPAVMAVLFGEPLDYPLNRPEKNAPGPGWTGDIIAPWGGLRSAGEPVTLHLKGFQHAVTGAVSDNNGELITRFCVPANTSHLLKLTAPPGSVYIHCDSCSNRLEVKTQ